jgi:polysaccharide export outer membrane protein
MIRRLINAALLLAACIGGSAIAQDKPDYPLGAGDTIRVQVFQNPDLTIETRVAESGAITYPLIGSVDLGGLSIAAAVLGQVNRPGRFPLETLNTRVSDMLAAAGGATPGGDDVVIVTGVRGGKPFRKSIDIPSLYIGENPSDDIVLAGGDTIYVHRAPMFYIYGEAQRPGTYRIERGMTVMQALAQGGGPTPRGSEYRLRLHRKNGEGAVEQLSPDMTDLVQPNDVIYVRESLF